MGKKKLYSASFTWNGKVITKRATTKEEAEKKRDQEKFMYEFGLKSLSSDILVKDWYPEWAEKYKHGRLSERAYKDDNSRIERFILPAIGHKKMKDVKQLDLMRILESMNETGYSKTSIMKVKSCMTQMFRDAIPNDIISHSPAAELPVPIGTKQARHIVITDEDRLAIINCKSKVHLWAMFLMFSGARPAEALTLKYSDLYPDHHAVFLNGTKTANAKRYVPLPDSIMDSILATKESSYGDYVFSDRVDGAPYNRNQTGRNWKRLINDVNISLGCKTYFSKAVPPFRFPDYYLPYDLRHAWFTDLQYSGMPLPMSKLIMGHSLGGVSDRYAHNKLDGVEKAYGYIVPYWIERGFLPESDAPKDA